MASLDIGFEIMVIEMNYVEAGWNNVLTHPEA
jgi:hypothetical protein